MRTKSFLETTLAEYALIAAAGAVGYYGIEVLWRGWSHWTMALAGALCFSLYYALCSKTRLPILLRALCGAAIITAVEFTVGLIVNLNLGWAVWDYSGIPLNLMGQVCLNYSLLWFLLCLPAAGLCRQLRQRVFGQS
ncbi:MAG: hypothetical protein IKL84_05795 [Clostridia bacterium]|nr:hypothetical protein [Clostridia bacterium]